MEHVTVKDLVLGSGGVLVSGVRKRLSPISAWIPGRWSRETFLCPCWASGWTATASFPR